MRGLGSLTIQSVLNAFLGFVFLASLVRFLSRTDYGTYSSVQVSVGIAGVVSVFGFSAAIVYYLASGATETAVGWGASKAALNLTVILTAAVCLFMVAAAPWLSAFYGKGTPVTWAFYLGAVWLFTSSVATPFQSMLQGTRSYGALARVLMASRISAVVVGVAGVAIFQSLAIAIVSWVVYSGLVIAAALPMVWAPLRRADARPYYSVVAKYASLLGLAGVVSVVASNADIVVVGGYLSLGSLAVYNAAIQISSVLSAFFIAPMVTALFAEASLSSQSEAEMRLGTGLAIRFVLATLIPSSLLAAAMASQLFGLFTGSGAYNQGIPYLQIITLFYAFSAIQVVAISILQGVKRTKAVLLAGTVTALGEVALSVLLVPSYGLAGAAYSRVTMFVVGSGLTLYLIRRYLPRPFDFRFLGKALILGAVPSIPVYLLSAFVSDRTLTLVPYALLGALLFIGCARTLKVITLEDKEYLSHVIPSQLQWILRLL